MKPEALVLAIALSGLTASAHHSVERTYDLKREVRVEGTVRQILLRNPHSFIQIEVTDGNGKAQIWSLEFPKGLDTLRKQGIEPGRLKSGDSVAIIMNPSFKPADNRGNMVALSRASDGFAWSAKVKAKRS